MYTLSDLDAGSRLGAVVHGLDLAHHLPAKEVLATLRRDMADRGFLVFPNVSLTADEMLRISKLFGNVAARHSVHPAAVHEEVLRLSNDATHGITGVGPQWHSDGSFERRPFSHVAFHAVQMPPRGGGTQITSLAGAYDALPARLRDEWSALSSVNAYSGVVHPLVHRHPISGRHVLFLHLGQTGAMVRAPASPTDTCDASPLTRDAAHLEAMHPTIGPSVERGHSALTADEMHRLLRDVNALLSRSELHTTYTYRASLEEGVGDLLILDNLAVAHRATPEAHMGSGDGLRILHRTTVEGTWTVAPPMAARLPPFAYIFGANPLNRDGVWQTSDHYGVGFRWNLTIPMRN